LIDGKCLDVRGDEIDSKKSFLLIDRKCLDVLGDEIDCKLSKFPIGEDDAERNEDSVGGENEPDDSKWPEAVHALNGDDDDEDAGWEDSKQTDQPSNPDGLK
jgi:hypothetical protein